VRIVLYKPSLYRKEFKRFRCGLSKPEISGLANPLWSYMCCPSTRWSFEFAHRVGGWSWMYVRYTCEISPTLILVPVLFNKSGTNKGSTRLNTGEPKSYSLLQYIFFMIIIFNFFSMYLKLFYYFYFILFYLFSQLFIFLA
jgi:hypothetical protein